jgi:hypothetical protein
MTFLATSIRNAAPLVARRAALKQAPVALSAIAQKRWNSNSVEVNLVVHLPAPREPTRFPVIYN